MPTSWNLCKWNCEECTSAERSREKGGKVGGGQSISNFRAKAWRGESDHRRPQSMAKRIASPELTGGDGFNFAHRVQAAFVTLMLADGYNPIIRTWPIDRILVEAELHGFSTDDLVVISREPGTTREARLIVQITKTLSIGSGATGKFTKVIKDAWSDFKQPSFQLDRDAFALVTGPLSAIDHKHARAVLDIARKSGDGDTFFDKVEKRKGIGAETDNKLQAFKAQMKLANGGVEPTKDEQWRFLRHFHMLSADLDIQKGLMLAFAHSLSRGAARHDGKMVWYELLELVRTRSGGELTRDSIPEEVKEYFGLVTPPSAGLTSFLAEKLLQVAFTLGEWDEHSSGDRQVIERLSGISFAGWKLQMRKLKRDRAELFEQHHGRWKVVNRASLLSEIGPLLSDSDINQFFEVTLQVLSSTPPPSDAGSDE
jgi:hypothetical protein